MVVPQGLVAPIGALKFLIDDHTPTFEQEVLADFGYACLEAHDINRGIEVVARSLDAVRPAASRRHAAHPASEISRRGP